MTALKQTGLLWTTRVGRELKPATGEDGRVRGGGRAMETPGRVGKHVST